MPVSKLPRFNKSAFGGEVAGAPPDVPAAVPLLAIPTDTDIERPPLALVGVAPPVCFGDTDSRAEASTRSANAAWLPLPCVFATGDMLAIDELATGDLAIGDLATGVVTLWDSNFCMEPIGGEIDCDKAIEERRELVAGAACGKNKKHDNNVLHAP